eukprot:2520211-Rhodomonas_salina.5
MALLGEVLIDGDVSNGYGTRHYCEYLPTCALCDLPSGTYAVYVNVNTPDATFDPACNHVLVSIYTELAGRSIRTFQAGLNTTGQSELTTALRI